MPFKKGFLSRAPYPITVVVPAVAGNVPIMVSATDTFEVLGADFVCGVVGGAGATLDLVAIPKAVLTGGLNSAGQSVLLKTIDLTANALVVQHVTGQSQSKRLIPLGGALVLRTTGTLTGLAGALLTVWVQSTRGIRAE